MKTSFIAWIAGLNLPLLSMAIEMIEHVQNEDDTFCPCSFNCSLNILNHSHSVLSFQDMIISGLQPETSYSLTVTAYTTKGDGARSKPKLVSTTGAGNYSHRYMCLKQVSGDFFIFDVLYQRAGKNYGHLLYLKQHTLHKIVSYSADVWKKSMQQSYFLLWDLFSHQDKIIKK